MRRDGDSSQVTIAIGHLTFSMSVWMETSLMVAYKVQAEIRIPVQEVLQRKKLMAHGFDIKMVWCVEVGGLSRMGLGRIVHGAARVRDLNCKGG